MGTTLADFQSSGIRPESRDCWKINASKLAECWQVNLSNLALMPSGQGLIFRASRLIALAAPCSVIRISRKGVEWAVVTVKESLSVEVRQ